LDKGIHMGQGRSDSHNLHRSAVSLKAGLYAGGIRGRGSGVGRRPGRVFPFGIPGHTKRSDFRGGKDLRRSLCRLLGFHFNTNGVIWRTNNNSPACVGAKNLREMGRRAVKGIFGYIPGGGAGVDLCLRGRPIFRPSARAKGGGALFLYWPGRIDHGGDPNQKILEKPGGVGIGRPVLPPTPRDSHFSRGPNWVAFFSTGATNPIFFLAGACGPHH